MNVFTIFENSLWAGLFATGLAILLTAPSQYVLATFLSGFFGRFMRDLLIGSGLGQNWSTAVTSAVLVLIAVAIVRRRHVPPVMLICGVLPLGAAVPMFHAIIGLLKVSTAQGEALTLASVELIANVGKAFTGTLVIALGLAAGQFIAQLVMREKAEGT